MSRLLFENKYFRMDFEDDTKILKTYWNEHSEFLYEEEVKEVILTIANHIAKESPEYILSDDSLRGFSYNVGMQKWVGETLSVPCIERRVKKYALVLPKELIAALSTQQTREEVQETVTQISYFENVNEALKWFRD